MEQQGLVFLGVFALLGFLMKVFIVANISIKSRISECFTIVCLLMMFANVAEFLGYFTYLNSPVVGQFFVNFYMAALYFVFPAILVLALALIESRYVYQARNGLFVGAGLISMAHFAGYMAAGYEILDGGWSVEIIPGQYYWLAIVWLVLNALAITGLLAYQYLLNQNFEIRKRCKVNLIAFSPILMVALIVPALKLAGFHASTAISLALGMMAFLVVMLVQTNGNIFWLSLKFKILLAVISLSKSDSLDEILCKIEEVRIREALRATNGKQKSAAKLLNVPASTLCKKICKYGIQRDDFQTVSVLGKK